MPTPLETPEQIACVAVGLGLLLFFTYLTRAAPETRARFLGGDGDFKWGALEPSHVSESGRKVHPCCFAILRLSFGGYALGTTLWRLLVWEDLPFIATFTGWSWFLLGIYFVLVGCLSIGRGFCGRYASQAEKRPACLHHFLWMFCQVMATCAIFICLIVWVILIPLDILTLERDVVMQRWFNYIDLSAHNANVLFMLIELRLNRMTFLAAHAPFIVLYGNVYIIFSWFWYWNAGFFFYPFLDWDLIGFATPICYLGLASVLYCAFLGMAKASVRLKRGVDPGLLPTAEGAPMSQTSSTLQLAPPSELEAGS